MDRKKESLDVLIVKAREHKFVYSESIEDIRIAYLLAVFQQQCLSTRVLDFAFSLESPDTDASVLDQAIRKQSPQIIIFILDKSPTNSPSYTVELLDGISSGEYNYKPHISLYGNTQTGYSSLFSHSIDSVILGEELSALSLVESVLSGRFPNGLDGVAFMNEENKISLVKATRVTDLDSLPTPIRYALTQTNMRQYSASILSSRGCFGNCNYCYLRTKEKVFSGYSWTGRSIKNVIDEVESLYKVGVREFSFVDDEFLPRGSSGEIRAESFANEITERGLKIRFSIYSRSDCITTSAISNLVRAGLYCVFLGVESFCQRVLDRYNKNLSVEQNITAINILKKYGVHIRLGMILFDRHTTMDELDESIQYLVLISESSPELLYQSMFFSNTLIPIADTPVESEYKAAIDQELVIGINHDLKLNCIRRGRSEAPLYTFSDPQISIVYSCVSYLSELMLAASIERENRLFSSSNYDNCLYKWFCGSTAFAIQQLSDISTLVKKGYSVQEIKKSLETALQNYDEKSK